MAVSIYPTVAISGTFAFDWHNSNLADLPLTLYNEGEADLGR
jgi:hypothetical protein